MLLCCTVFKDIIHRAPITWGYSMNPCMLLYFCITVRLIVSQLIQFQLYCSAYYEPLSVSISYFFQVDSAADLYISGNSILLWNSPSKNPGYYHSYVSMYNNDILFWYGYNLLHVFHVKLQ